MDSERDPQAAPDGSSSQMGDRRVYVQPDELGSLLAKRRRDLKLSLGQVSRETGISTATLSRWERKRTDGDPHKLQIVARWLGVELDPATSPIPQTFHDPVDHGDQGSTVEYVEAHLRADRNLDSKTAAALARVFQAAYEQFAPQHSKDREESP